MMPLVLVRFALRVTLTTALLALVLTWQVGRHVRSSAFFAPNAAHLAAEERRVTDAADALLDALIAAEWRAPASHLLFTDFCVAVTSGRARRQRYVRRTVAALLREWIALDDADPLKSRFQVHVVAPPLDELNDPDALLPRDYRRLARLVLAHSESTRVQFLPDRLFAREDALYRRVLADRVPPLSAAQIAAHVARRRAFYPYWDREIANYVRALDACAPVSRYTLVLEDDAVAARDMPALLAAAVAHLEALHHNATVDWAWIKLFHTDHFDGWSLDSLPTLLACAAAPAALAGAVVYARVSRNLALIVALQVLVAALILLLGLGRQAWFRSAPPGLSVSNVSCCIPAQLYNNRIVPSIVSFLSDPPYVDPVDRLLDEFRARHNATLLQYMLVPHLFQHIGRYASYVGKNQGSWAKMVVSTSFAGEREWPR
jgi:hypothetical protein